MRKFLSLVLSAALVVSAVPSAAFANEAVLSGYSTVYAESGEYMDFESFKVFKVTKLSADDTIEVIINGKPCVADSSASKEVVLDLCGYIEHTGLNNIVVKEHGDFESEYSIDTVITKKSYIPGYQTDYEEFDIGDETAITTLDKEGMTIRPNTGYVKIDTIDEEHGNSLVYGLENATATKSPFVANKTTASSGIYEYEFDMYIDRVDLNFRLNSRYNDTYGTTRILPMFNCIKGDLRMYDGGGWKVHGTISARTWYTFKFILNYTDLTYDFYLNGTSLVDDYTMNMPDFKAMNDHMRLEVEVTEGNSNFIAWDNFTYRQIISQPYIESINNGDKLDPAAESFDVKLSGEYDDISKEDILITADGNPVDIASVSSNGDVLSVTPKYPLSSGYEYKLIIKKGVVTSDGAYTDIATAGTFGTKASDPDLANGSVSDGLTFEADVVGSKAVEAVMVLTDADGRIKSYIKAESENSKIALNASDSDASGAEGFALYSGKPVGDKLYSTYGVVQSVYTGSATGMENVSYNNTDKSITLYGTYSGGDNKLLAAHIYPKSGSGADAYYAFLTGADGAFSQKILLPVNFGGGKYIVELTGSIESGASEFTYINEDELSGILSDVNSAESSLDMRTVISAKRNALGIDEAFSEEDINLIADMIYANRKSGYTNSTLSKELAADSAAVLIKKGTAVEEAINTYASAFANDNYNCAVFCGAVSENVLLAATDKLINADLLCGKAFADITAEILLVSAISGAESAGETETALFGTGINVFAFLNISSSEYNETSDKDAIYTAIYDGREKAFDIETARELIETSVHRQYEYETSPQSPINFPTVSAEISPEMSANELSAVNVEASDPNGSIAMVCGYFDGILCSSITEAPYVLDFSDGITGFGLHELKITATDNDGNTAEAVYSVNIIRTEDVGEFETDFEEYSPGSADAISDLTNGKLSLNTGNGGYTVITKFDDEHKNVLSFGKEKGAKPTGNVFFGNNTYSSRGTYTYEFDIYFSRTDVGGNITTRYLKTDGSAGFLYFANVRSNNIVFKNGKADGASAKITAENWHRFKMVLDYSALTFDFYWDGELVAKDYTFGCDDFVSMNNHTRLEMRFGDLDANEEGFVAIDNYSYVHNIEYPRVSEIYANASGEEKVDHNSQKINILLTDGFENMDLSRISLCRDGRMLPLKTVSVSGENNELVTIEPQYPLVSSAKYTLVLDSSLITLDGYTMDYNTNAEFETTASDFDMTDASFKFEKSRLTFSGTAINTAESDKTFTAIMSLYDAGGAYDSYVTKTLTAKAGENTPVSVSIQSAGGYSAKVFFVDDINSMKPVFANVYAMNPAPAPEALASKPEALTLTPAYSDETKLLSLFGATPLDAESMVIFTIAKADESESVVLDAVIASENGAYLSELKLKSNLPGGKYAITAVSGEHKKEDSFMYINEPEAEVALKSVNTASKQELSDILKNNAGKLGIDEEIFAKDSQSFADYIYFNKPSKGYTLSEFASAVNGASAGVLIKAGTDVESVLARYSGVLSGCAERYGSLNPNEKSEFASNIAKADLSCGDSFDIIFIKTLILTDFRESTSWYDAKTVVLGTDADGNKINNNFELINPDTSEYKSVSDKNALFEKMYVSRKSASDFDDIALLFEKAADDVKASENKKDSSKGSGGGGGGGGSSVSMAPVASAPTPVQTATLPSAQTDISGHWAEAVITELCKAGIMNGYGNGIYRPDSFITRAEFVKLMSVAFDIPTAYGSDFADVSTDAWYAPYVSGAYATGLVNGTSENTFSPESQITRQDAAVIAERYLSGICTLEAAPESFEDSDYVADYAKDSVLKLKGALILKGNGNNTFNPASNITRAEAASIILGIITYIQAH